MRERMPGLLMKNRSILSLYPARITTRSSRLFSMTCNRISIDEQQGRDFADTGFDGVEANQLAVELIEYFLDIGGLEFGLEVDLVTDRGNIRLCVAHSLAPARIRGETGRRVERAAH